MRRNKAAVFLALFSIIAVVGIASLRLNKSSPGPLAAVHARLPELAAWNGCAQCHGGLFGSMTQSCFECHKDVAQQVEDGHGLHGAVQRRDGVEAATQCARCHSEHHGEDFAMVHRGSFALAGIADRASFDHVLIGFELLGKHRELACSACHEHADAKVLPEGAKRFTGLARDCAACHEDVHQGRMQRACADCHVQTSFTDVRAPWHDRHLQLTGGHGDVACRACHEKDTAHAFERQSPTTPRACAQCHASPHSDAFARGNAQAANKGIAAACVLCHEASHTSFRDERLVVTPAQHAHAGFVISGPHATVSCAQCHSAELASHALRHPGRSQDACQACHTDPHGGQFAVAGGASTCRDCHRDDSFRPHLFDAERHKETRFELTGHHATLDCAKCHEGDAHGVRRFRGTEHRCDACHRDAHRGYFELREPALKDEAAGTCRRCHDTASFSQGARERFDHGAWTGFALEGAHAAERCETCHRLAVVADEAGRSFGRCSDTFGDVSAAGRTCQPCHVDPHLGRFDREERERVVDGREGCARCHDASSFRSLVRAFDHGQWTGFSLDGSHEKLACTECHDSAARPAAADRGRAVTWGHAKGTACADCHVDPHAGQFEGGGVSDCAKCHRPTRGFSDLVFNHEIHARFKLGEAHRGLACAACHRSERKGEVDFIRYKPLGRACSDCHATRPRPFSRRTSK